ncbi:arylsulfotransferase family protein [Maribacter sp. 2307UL18-2]|uniref:arylsulfotransferase family protein n=1 Tax=Maribacter sp. 2307UL18-2 TaxID=3386274 RepID=UPI0039BC89DB
MKKLRVLFIIVAAVLFYSIGLSSLVRNIYLSYDGGEKWGAVSKTVKFLAEVPTYIKKSTSQPEFMVKNTTAKDGLTVENKIDGISDMKLLFSYKDESFGQKFDLVQLNSGKVEKEWRPDNRELYSLAYNEDNPRKSPEGSDLYFMHPYMTKDSSLIFNSQLTSLLTRIDSQSKLQWLNNDRRYHHTIEEDHEGKLYVCTAPFEAGTYDILPDNQDFYKKNLMDDEITRLDPESGKIIWSKSVIQILLDNGYENILLNKGQFISDIIHLNDIQPALTDGEYWNKGDLLISCRNICTVFLYRPSTNKILWLKNGPWYNQHDADFYENDKIVVFGNDIIREESTLNPKVTPKNLYFNERRKNNEIYIYDLVKDSVSTPYSRLMSSEKITTITSGRCDILPNGDIFIEETNNGRIIFGDTIAKKMEYAKRIDQNHVSSLFWSRLINN